MSEFRGAEVARNLLLTAAQALPETNLFTGRLGGRSLVVDCGVTPARFIRISSNKSECFHLSWVEISASCEGARYDQRKATMRTSSIYEKTDDLVKRAALLSGEVNQRFGFHTQREPRPWVEIDLRSEVSLEKLEIWNRNDGFESRSWNLNIDISVDGNQWTNVHTGRGEDRLVRVIALFLDVLKDNDCTQDVIDSLEILNLVLGGAYAEAKKALASASSMTAPQKTELRAFINKEVLSDRQMEWNIHGIRRTYRFWTNSEKEAYIGFCNSVVDALRDLSPHVCYGFGSVLSIVRNGDFIPHDDDLDILICFDREDCRTITEGIGRITEFLKSAGFQIRGDRLSTHRQILKDGGKSVDVFVGLNEGGKVSWYPQARGTLDINDVFPASSADLLGFRCPIPRNATTYLQAVYGPHWRKPDSGWRHNWSLSPYKDIL